MNLSNLAGELIGAMVPTVAICAVPESKLQS